MPVLMRPNINGVVLNNVNADPRILHHLKKVAALADVFKIPYTANIFTANFAAPLKTVGKTQMWWSNEGGIGDLDTADPRDPVTK